jgi:hypothetical protein
MDTAAMRSIRNRERRIPRLLIVRGSLHGTGSALRSF